MSRRKIYSPEFEAKVAPEALKGERTVAELPSQFGVRPTMIGIWKSTITSARTAQMDATRPPWVTCSRKTKRTPVSSSKEWLRLS